MQDLRPYVPHLPDGVRRSHVRHVHVPEPNGLRQHVPADPVSALHRLERVMNSTRTTEWPS